MVANTRWDIRDYIQKAGMGGQTAVGRRSVPTPGPGSGSAFSEVFQRLRASVQASDAPARGGMRIAAYRQRPVPAHFAAMPPSPQTGQASPGANEPSGIMQEMMPITPDGAPPVGDDPAAFSALPEEMPAADRIAESIRAAAEKYNLPAALIHSVIRAESNFDPGAVSRAGAQGLMQLMPATAEELGVRDPFDIEQNIDGGACYLRRMMDQFGQDLRKALAAYNAGPGTVRRYNGNVPYVETRNYVEKVLAYTHDASTRRDLSV